MKIERVPGPSEEPGLKEKKRDLKEGAIHELKEFLAMFIYLWVFFALLVIHESVILAQEHQDFVAHGFAILDALILAKVLLIGEDLHLGSRFRDKPLVFSILYKSFAFSLVFIGFHIVERVVVGVSTGRSIAQSFPVIGGGSLKGIFSVAAILFVGLIPFFAFRELARVIGQNELRSLLLTRGTKVDGQSRPQQ